MTDWKKQVAEFKTGLAVEAPRLSASCIRFGFFGSVGGGKSVTAGIFAVGITPAPGLIGWVDGEGKRSGFAIDQVAEMAVKKYGATKAQWGERFKVVHVDPPFHPLKVVAAIEALEEAGCLTIIADIMSQAWDSDGGYLDLKEDELDRTAGDDWKARERKSAAASSHVKRWTHQKLVNKVNHSQAHMVLLFQAKAKYNPETHKPDDFVTPIQESGLTRTAIAVGRVEAKMVGEEPQGGFCTFRGAIEHGTKFTHPSILRLLPRNGEQFRFEHAESVAAWMAGSKSPVSPTPASKERDALAKELWTLTQEIHKGNKAALQQWMVDEAIITETETLSALSTERIRGVLGKTQMHLSKSAKPTQKESV